MPTGDFKIPIGYIWTDCGGWIPASPYFGPIMTTSPAPSAIPLIDVTTQGPDGHWDYEDIKRLCEYRDRLRVALREAGQNVYQGGTSGGWIDHGPQCEAGIDERPCNCGLAAWLAKYAADLGVVLPPPRNDQPQTSAPSAGDSVTATPSDEGVESANRGS